MKISSLIALKETTLDDMPAEVSTRRKSWSGRSWNEEQEYVPLVHAQVREFGHPGSGGYDPYSAGAFDDYLAYGLPPFNEILYVVFGKHAEHYVDVAERQVVHRECRSIYSWTPSR